MRRLISILLIVFAFNIVAFAGWETDSIGTKYINDDGTIKTGWHQDVDGKWYYLDNDTGYILKDTVTPDGFPVSVTGEWIQDMEKQKNKYENQIDLSISGIGASSTSVSNFGYEVPIKVYYNNQYNNAGGGTIKISGIEVSKEGAPYITISANDIKGSRYGINQIIKYTLDDGTAVEKTKMLGGMTIESSFVISLSLMSDPDIDWDFGRKKVSSAEIMITEYIPENK